MMSNRPARGNLYFLLLLLYEVCIQALLYFFMIQDPGMNVLFWSSAGLFLYLVPPLWIFLLLTRQKLSQVIPHEELTFTNVGLIVLMSLAIQPVMMFLSALSNLFFTNTLADVMSEMLEQPFYLVLISIALIPSVLEEITLRGVFLSHYSQVDIRKAAFVNGLFFGILHLNPSQFLYAAAVGYVFTYFVRYTRSIYASIISHFVINGCQALLLLWYRSLVHVHPEWFTEVGEVTLSDRLYALGDSLILALIFFPVFYYILRNFIAYNKKRNIGILLTEKVMTQLDNNPYVRPKIFNWSFWVSVGLYLLFMTLLLLSSLYAE